MGDTPFSVPNIRFCVVGDRSVLPDYLNDMIVGAEAATSSNSKFNFQIALGYGGRSEVTRATKLAVNAKVREENVSLEAAVERITAADISRQTYSAQLGSPQIDAIIRTSRENRVCVVEVATCRSCYCAGELAGAEAVNVFEELTGLVEERSTVWSVECFMGKEGS